MVEKGPRAGAVEDVLLEEVLAGGHVAVQELGTAEKRPAVPAERNCQVNIFIERRAESIWHPYAIETQR